MPRAAHPCWTCGKIFSSATFFRYHFTVEHTPAGTQCSVCSQKLPNWDTLSRHINAHLRNSHSCNICTKVCPTKLHLYVHLTVCHMYDGKAACNLCKSKFSQIHFLRPHYLTEHSSSIPSLEQKADLFCTLHSHRVFPEEARSLDLGLNENVDRNHSETVENGDKLGEGKRYICSKLSALVLRIKAATAPEHVTVVQEPSGHPKDGTKSASDACLDAEVQLPLRQLDVLDPACELNKTGPKQCAGGPDRFGFDKQKDTQPVSVPDNRNVLGYEVKFVEGIKTYICDLCGMAYENLDSLYAAHIPIESYFTTGQRTFSIQSSHI